MQYIPIINTNNQRTWALQQDMFNETPNQINFKSIEFGEKKVEFEYILNELMIENSKFIQRQRIILRVLLGIMQVYGWRNGILLAV